MNLLTRNNLRSTDHILNQLVWLFFIGIFQTMEILGMKHFLVVFNLSSIDKEGWEYFQRRREYGPVLKELWWCVLTTQQLSDGLTQGFICLSFGSLGIFSGLEQPPKQQLPKTIKSIYQPQLPGDRSNRHCIQQTKENVRGEASCKWGYGEE